MMKFKGMKLEYCGAEVFGIKGDDNIINFYWTIPGIEDIYFLLGFPSEGSIEEDMQFFIESCVETDGIMAMMMIRVSRLISRTVESDKLETYVKFSEELDLKMYEKRYEKLLEEMGNEE